MKTSNQANTTKYSQFAVSLVCCTPILIMLGLIVACDKISEQVFDQRINEGIIEYEITFPELGSESITASLLPEKMVYRFSENCFASNFETAGGIFQNNITADYETKNLEHKLKVFRKKIKVDMEESQVLRMLTQYPHMTVINTNQVDTIAGFPCKKALIVFEAMDSQEIEVYYTQHIKMNNPNWCTPYHEIDGVLMAYEIEEFGVRMRLEAKAVKNLDNRDCLKPLNDGDFVPITREMMEAELGQLVETFSF